MAEYLNKDLFLSFMGLVGDETKYGNRDGEHQNRSYSTWMGYEIMGSVDDSIVEGDVVEVVRCKDCKHFVSPQGVPCCDEFMGLGFPHPSGDDFCSYGERRTDETKAD